MLEFFRRKCEIKGMKSFWRRAKPFVWGALCVVLALYLSPLSVTLSYALATHDFASLWALLFNPGFAFMMAFGGMFMAFAAICIALGAAIEAYQKRARLTPKFYYAALFCVVCGAGWVFYPGIRIAWPTRRAGLQQAATRAQPLIFAIEKFRLENKRAPYNLQELVPIYLSKIPQTGMGAYPRFRYKSREESGENARFQSYQLQISTSAGFINWDTFNYWPEGDYPSEMYGGTVERIGAWAYVHE